MSKKIIAKGFDISTYQGKISVANFKKAKAAGYSYVILRLGYTGNSKGGLYEDNCFEYNYKNAIAAGLHVGAYWYSGATTTAKVTKEVNKMTSMLKGKTIKYPVYMDVEENNNQGKLSKGTLAIMCDSYCKQMKAAGYTPGIYASLSWFNNKIGTIKETHTKWVAQYNTECQYKGEYDMWQNSSTTKVPGIGNKIDVNICYKDFINKEEQKETKKAYTGSLPSSTIKKGSKGDSVKLWQKYLNWYNGKTVCTIDGNFGSVTLKYTRAFQKAQKLTVDGVVGTKTIAAAKKVKK